MAAKVGVVDLSRMADAELVAPLPISDSSAASDYRDLVIQQLADDEADLRARLVAVIVDLAHAVEHLKKLVREEYRARLSAEQRLERSRQQVAELRANKVSA